MGEIPLICYNKQAKSLSIIKPYPFMSWWLKLLLTLEFIQSHQDIEESESFLITSIPLIENVDVNYPNISHVEQFFWCKTIHVLDLEVLQGVQNTPRHIDYDKAGK